MKIIIILIALLGFISCNEDGPVNSGSDKTVIEKSLAPSNTDINLSTSDGINITIPADALNSNLDIKVIKLANPPASTDSKLKVGSNVFKISLNGSLNFNDDIVIHIKYDKSKIQSGLTVLNGVKGIVYVNNGWQNVDCDFDIVREEIVIKFNPQSKINKFKEKLQDENSVIFGDGYTTTDSGQDDNPVFKTKHFYMNEFPHLLRETKIYDSHGNGNLETHTIDTTNASSENILGFIAYIDDDIEWGNNKFSNTYIKNDTGVDINYKSECELSKDGKKLISYSLKGYSIDYFGTTSYKQSELTIEFEIKDIFFDKYETGIYYFTLNKNLNNSIVKMNMYEKEYWVTQDQYGSYHQVLDRETKYSKLDWDIMDLPYNAIKIWFFD
mgnify:CR=1 FL=1